MDPLVNPIYLCFLPPVTKVIPNTCSIVSIVFSFCIGRFKLVRNVDGERSEGRSSVCVRRVLPSGEWIVINLFVANCCHLANKP